MKINHLILFILCFSISCSSLDSRKPSGVIQNAEIDPAVGEELEENEAQAIQKVIDAAMEALKRDFKAPRVPRDAHAKSPGCLRGFFEVHNENLPEELKLGLFSENKKFPAWIRFSNNTSDPMSKDSDLDLRGIAVKVMNVPGEKILPQEINESTQDFLMFASPIFFIKDIKDYSEFIKALGDGKAIKDLATRPRALVQLANAQIKASFERNPLRLRYFSAAPYRLGDIDNPNRRPVKYSFKSCDDKVAKAQPQGDKADPNFMRKSLKKSLSQKEACFQFQVQLGDSRYPDIFPVEDPSILWPETPGILGIRMNSPYVSVATLRIPKQDFDKPELDQFCERLSFTPWHAKKEHRPLGRTNRMRRALYEEISKYRHSANGVLNLEPVSHDLSKAFPAR